MSKSNFEPKSLRKWKIIFQFHFLVSKNNIMHFWTSFDRFQKTILKDFSGKMVMIILEWLGLNTKIKNKKNKRHWCISHKLKGIVLVCVSYILCPHTIQNMIILHMNNLEAKHRLNYHLYTNLRNAEKVDEIRKSNTLMS